MDSVFETVQAILKDDVRQYLEKKIDSDIFLNLKSLIANYKETLQVFESNGLTTLIGSLKAILVAQEFLSSYLKEEEEDSRINNFAEVAASSEKLRSEIAKSEEVSIYKANNNLTPKDAEKCELEPKCEASSHNVGFDTRSNDLGIAPSSHCIQGSNIYPNSNHFSTLYPSTRGNIRVTTSVINISPKYSCESCPFRSSKEKLFLKHLKYHKKKDDSHARISCISCREYFTRVSEYEEHMKSKHKGRKGRPDESCKNRDEKNLKCEICDFEAQNGREYKNHSKSHHPITYSCSQCKYKAKKRNLYIRHVKNVHENVRPFSCQVCGSAFKRPDSLKQHQFIHSREAQFQCDICNKVFRSSNMLRDHLLTHSNIRSYLCEICGASFKTRGVHRNHMKVVHSQVLQATCKTCGKTYCTKYSLKRHILQHQNRNSEDWVTDAHLEKNGPCSNDIKAKPSNKHVDLIASAWANASCSDDGIIETVYTGLPPDNFNISIDNQIPYIVHSSQEILTE